MRIEELYLSGFGRFTNTRIRMEEGLNLIFGENEAGKTTLQHFIVGMLYGFFVATARRKTYTDDYARYAPWNSDAVYGGTMICEKDGQRYRIQRVFQKEKESVVIFDADSGEDISGLFPYDSVTRLRDPGPVLCGVSRTVFCNTANVAQLEISPQGDFSGAWEDQILSLTETADSSLSLQSVCKALDDRADAIGSPKRRKTPYGQAAERMDELQQELVEAERAQQTITQLRQRVQELQVLKDQQEAKQQQEAQSKWAEQLSKANIIRSRIEEVEQLIKEKDGLEDPDLIQQQIGAIQQAKQNLNREETGFVKWDGRLKEINQRYLAQPIRMQDLKVLDHCLNLAKNSLGSRETRQLRDELQRKQSEFIAIPHISSNELMEALVEYESWDDEINQNGFSMKLMIFLIGLFLAGFGIALGWIMDAYFYIGAVIGALLVIVSFFISSAKKEAQEAREEQEQILERCAMNSYEELKANCDDIQKREDQRLELMTQIELLAMRLKKVSDENPQRMEELNRYAAKLTKNPEAVWDEDLEEQVKYARELCVEFEEMSAQRNEEQQKIIQRHQEVDSMEEELQRKLSALGIEEFSDEAFQKLRERRREREQAAMELQLQQQLLKECLGNLTYEELQAKIHMQERSEAGAYLDGENFDYRSVLEELAQLQGKLSTMEQFQRPAGEIKEEYKALQEQCISYQNTLDAIILAKHRLQKVSSSINKDMSPVLGKRLSTIVEKLTNGKYSKVLLSRDLHIRLEDPKSGQLVPITALSRGTMDLIYLAMRMELLKVISTDNVLPMLLDDSFVQLDDLRTANLLNYLAGNRQGQVMLLTCHNREESILKAQSVPYHRITLGQ